MQVQRNPPVSLTCNDYHSQRHGRRVAVEHEVRLEDGEGLTAHLLVEDVGIADGRPVENGGQPAGRYNIAQSPTN